MSAFEVPAGINGPDERVLRAADDPARFNQVVNQEVNPLPEAEDPAALVIDLPGGFLGPDGRLHRTVELRELNGADEEALAKYSPASQPAQFLKVLLAKGVASVGDYSPPPPEIFDSLLMGDREAIVLGIRRATYGDELELGIVCPNCTERSNVAVDLVQDVKIQSLEDPMTRVFTVPLRKGREATLRIPLASDQDEVFNSKRETIPELNTVLLRNILLDVGGEKVNPLELGASDRRTLITELSNHNIGPDYNDIPVPCVHCGKEDVLINITLMLLFR